MAKMGQAQDIRTRIQVEGNWLEKQLSRTEAETAIYKQIEKVRAIPERDRVLWLARQIKAIKSIQTATDEGMAEKGVRQNILMQACKRGRLIVELMQAQRELELEALGRRKL